MNDKLKRILIYFLIVQSFLAICLCFMMLEVVMVMKYELSRPTLQPEYAPKGEHGY